MAYGTRAGQRSGEVKLRRFFFIIGGGGLLLLLVSSPLVVRHCVAQECEAATAASSADTSHQHHHQTTTASDECVATSAAVIKEDDPKCPSRRHVIACAGKYLDLNQNGKLERSELQSAIDGLPWFSRGILNLLGSVDKMMRKCDIDQDDAISIGYDMEHNAETCLATCLKRRVFKSAFFPYCKL